MAKNRFVVGIPDDEDAVVKRAVTLKQCDKGVQMLADGTPICTLTNGGGTGDGLSDLFLCRLEDHECRKLGLQRAERRCEIAHR